MRTGVLAVSLGTVAWLMAFAVLFFFFRTDLQEHNTEWWLTGVPRGRRSRRGWSLATRCVGAIHIDRSGQRMADETHDDALVTVVVEPAGEQADREQPVEVPTPSNEDWPLDEVCFGAVDLARETLLQEADAALIGEHTGAIAEAPRL